MPAAPSVPAPPQPDRPEPSLLDRYVAIEKKQGSVAAEGSAGATPSVRIRPQNVVQDCVLCSFRIPQIQKRRTDFWKQEITLSLPWLFRDPTTVRWNQPKDDWVSALGLGFYLQNGAMSLGTAPVTWFNLKDVDTMLSQITQPIPGRFFFHSDYAVDGFILSFKAVF